MIETARLGKFLAQAAGVALLVSIVFWWIGLLGWAEGQVGYLDVDALGAAPVVWTILLAVAGLALVTRILPRRNDKAANISATLLFLIVTGALASVNIAVGAGDGTSAAGWLMAVFSLAQVIVFVGGMFADVRRS
jgi:hypothetical protein